MRERQRDVGQRYIDGEGGNGEVGRNGGERRGMAE